MRCYQWSVLLKNVRSFPNFIYLSITLITIERTEPNQTFTNWIEHELLQRLMKLNRIYNFNLPTSIGHSFQSLGMNITLPGPSPIPVRWELHRPGSSPLSSTFSVKVVSNSSVTPLNLLFAFAVPIRLNATELPKMGLNRLCKMLNVLTRRLLYYIYQPGRKHFITQ